MPESKVKNERNADVALLSGLTRRQLKELEEKEKTPAQKTAEAIIMILPLLCGCIAMAEYVILPNNSRNSKPWSYVWVLGAAMCIYLVCFAASLARRARGEKQLYEKLRYKAPRYAALFIFLAVYDYLTLKTGTLTQPFVPCMNYIINAFLVDYKMLADCTLNTLKLLFIGYSIGVTLGLITGIACGYSKKARYWLDPIIKFLGPIPTSTWIPIIMVVATSLFGGAVFIIAHGHFKRGQGIFRGRAHAGRNEQAACAARCHSPCNALHFAGLHAGHELILRSNNDCRDAGREVRPWLVHVAIDTALMRYYHQTENIQRR